MRSNLQPEKSNLELKLSVDTRWNSIYIMLNAFNELYLGYSTTVKKKGVIPQEEKPDFEVSSSGEKLLGDILALLKDFKLAIDIWEADKYVSISVVYPVLFRIVKKLSENKPKTEEGEALRNKIKQVIFRFSMEDEEFLGELSVHVLGSFFDPRFKQLTFLDESVRDNEVVTTEMNKIPVEETPMEIIAKTSKLSELLGGPERATQRPRKETTRQELERYKQCDHLGIGECPVQWWKENERKFPRISKLARKYLQIPATSASSERSFSTFGNIYCPKRMSLKTSTAEAVLFLNKNSKFL